MIKFVLRIYEIAKLTFFRLLLAFLFLLPRLFLSLLSLLLLLFEPLHLFLDILFALLGLGVINLLGEDEGPCLDLRLLFLGPHFALFT